MWAESRIRTVARGAYGLVARPQLLDLGVSVHEIDHRIESGRLERLHPGVYYLDATIRTWHTDVLAAVMAADHGERRQDGEQWTMERR